MNNLARIHIASGVPLDLEESVPSMQIGPLKTDGTKDFVAMLAQASGLPSSSVNPTPTRPRAADISR